MLAATQIGYSNMYARDRPSIQGASRSNLSSTRRQCCKQGGDIDANFGPTLQVLRRRIRMVQSRPPESAAGIGMKHASPGWGKSNRSARTASPPGREDSFVARQRCMPAGRPACSSRPIARALLAALNGWYPSHATGRLPEKRDSDTPGSRSRSRR